jgi:diguanylate cyclase (GGDEF)-like protein
MVTLMGPIIIAVAMLALACSSRPAAALKTIEINPDTDRLEITTLGEAHEGAGDNLQIETAPGADGVTGRMLVHAQTPGTSPSWFVFALTNPTDKPIERWLIAERFNTVGSGVVWPDLDARRINNVTPSVGFVPERIKNDRADIFRLTLEPGQTVSFVVELSSERFARLFLWKGLEYEQKSRDRQLFNGIMLGITVLLAVFLTAVFAANHKAIFPTAALFTWCVLVYLCVDFGFWHKIFNVRPEENAQYRAASEAAAAATLLIFTFSFLRLRLWHGFIRMLFGLWMAAQLALIAVAFLDPQLAATFARLSMLAIAGVGGMLILFLALRGQDRALSLVPTWILLLVWLFGAALTLTGRLSGDLVVFLLVSGLVLIVLLIGFTVTQYAFRSSEPLYSADPGQGVLRALAIDGAGAAVWEWNARRDEIKVGPAVEAALGLNPGELCLKCEHFLAHLHPADRERLLLLLLSVKERAGGELRINFRMRHLDNSYRWFELDAASAPSTDRRALRCVGLLREVTDAKHAQERLMHDAVRDSLTGLPNRVLFLDRLSVVATRAKSEPLVRPAIMFINLDKFKSVNSSLGLVIGDSLLLTVARRLARHLGPHDTLGRVGGDQFAILILNEQDLRALSLRAEHIRQALRSPINIAGREIVLTASIGIAVYNIQSVEAIELLRDAEVAMCRARRLGSDRIEVFQPQIRVERDERVTVEGELRRAIEKKQLRVLYQPIMYLPTEELAGFEALVRWEHPRLGRLNPTDFVPVAGESDLITRLGSFVITRAVQEAQRWQKEIPRPDNPIFVSINISSRQLLRQELVNEIRHIIGRSLVAKGSLRLEVTEALVMDNPEQATEMLRLLAGAGAGLALDDFGIGYSSLSYLQQFPFDTIKVDRALVHASNQDGSSSTIMRAIVALAHELGKKVVAEGVEAEADIGFLRSIGCEFAQGFYYGEPMSERDVYQLLKVIRKVERRRKRRGLFSGREQTAMSTPTQNAPTPPPAKLLASPLKPPAQEPSTRVRIRSSQRATTAPRTRPNGVVSEPGHRPGTAPPVAMAPGGRLPVAKRVAQLSAPPRQRPPEQHQLPAAATNAPPRGAPVAPPDFSTLPPAIAESLSKLAGMMPGAGPSGPPAANGISDPAAPHDGTLADGNNRRRGSQ